jgi:hypothetical protein
MGQDIPKTSAIQESGRWPTSREPPCLDHPKLPIMAQSPWMEWRDIVPGAQTEHRPGEGLALRLDLTRHFASASSAEDALLGVFCG